jgi:WD40 repeat protein/transcriptional regulator with XRE-family HTH domain
MRGDAQDREDADFRDQLLRLRGRAGLSQRELAALTSASERAIRAWEAGVNYPSADRLKALIAVYVQRGVFIAGQERTEAGALWNAARVESPRLQAPFDPGWFAELLARAPSTARSSAAAMAQAPVDRVAVLPLATRGRDWGEAPDVVTFHGRAQELATLTGWALTDGCPLVALLGMGGIGKTALAVHLARELAPQFDAVYWRSLRNAPPPGEWLAGAILSLSAQQMLPAENEEARLRQLLELLRERRSLLVLDNFEIVLEPAAVELGYREGYAGYGQVLQAISEAGRPSCLVITSRELPPEVGLLDGPQAPVRALRLGGVDGPVGQALLANRGLVGDATAWLALVTRYGGNPLALLMVGETIRALFGGEIATFLTEGEAVFGDIRRLLDAHVARLSVAERAVLDWLAVEREPVAFATLVDDLGATVPRVVALEALEALRRRSLLERGEQGATFTLQPVVLEHTTERLVERLTAEIARGQSTRLVSHAVIQAQAKEYVRRSQERLIGEPLLQRLQAECGALGAEQRLLALLDDWRERPRAEQGYGPGNVTNLLRLLRGDLRGLDLAHLALRQAYLTIPAQGSRLVGAHLSDSVLAEPMSAVVSTALSSDGTYVLVGTLDGSVRLWQLADRRLMFALEGLPGPVWGVALSGDGRVVASGAGDLMVRVWNALSGECLHVLAGHTAAVWRVALSADGQRAASVGLDATVRLWDTTSGECLHVLTGHTGIVWGVALSADGQRVASVGLDATVRLWDTTSGECLRVLTGHSGAMWRLALSGDGQRVASGGVDATVRVWDTASGECLQVLAGHNGAVWGVGLSGDGQRVASGGLDATVRVWDAASGECLRVLAGYTGGVWGVTFSADGRLVASGAGDGTVRLWDTTSGECLRVLTGHTAIVRSVALSGAGDRVASGAEDGTVRLWDAASGECLHVLAGHTGGVWGVALSEAGDLVASGGLDTTVRVWDAASGECLHVLVGHPAAVWGVALRGDGRVVASGAADATVRLWDAVSGECLRVLTAHTSGVLRSVALSVAGDRVTSGAEDGTVWVWDVASGECLHVLAGHNGAVWAVALSADGQQAASGGWEGVGRVWDAVSGECLQVLSGHTGGVWSVALSRDGRRLASAGLDGTVRLWDARSGACLRTLRPVRLYERLDITGLTGVTAAQRVALLALGAVDHSGRGVPA